MRKHRGLAPEDRSFFEPERVALLQKAVCDLSWLLGRRYPPRASVILVGNHYQLTERERLAIVHAASDGKPRKTPETTDSIKGKSLCIDGFNLLITLEAALGGGIVLRGMDGCYRDIANIHGSYTLRLETEKAIALTGDAIKELEIKDTLWLFDRPVSNSGRLARLVNDTAEKLPAPMRAITADQVDTKVKTCKRVAITADSAILDSGTEWFNLAAWLIEHKIPDAKVIDLKNDCRE